MSEPLVKVEHLSKKFCRGLKRSLWYGIRDIGSELTGMRRSSSRLRKDEFWALKDIDFEIHKGELVGLIGANGAGKTTLLKVLSGLIKPDEGEVTIRGKIQALIALGAGFNPVLTGRENIYINGAVLGFTRKEMDVLLEDILEFSEMREFIDMPVRSYSSGMHVRLGFAVAVNLKPDILIVDEVLAVGDASFRRKARNKMMELLHSGISVLFVSHNLALVSSLTSRCIYLDKGRVVSIGPSEKVTSLYLSDSIKKAKAKENEKRTAAARGDLLMEAAYMTVPDAFVLRNLRFTDSAGNDKTEFRTFDDLRIEFELDFIKQTENIVLAVNVRDQIEDMVISSTKMNLNGAPCEGIMKVECLISNNKLREGNFNIGFYVSDRIGGSLYKSHNVGSFSILADMGLIKENDPNQGFMVMDTEWKVM